MRQTVEEGSSQPVACPKCKAKEGYYVADILRVTYHVRFSASGDIEPGEYSNDVREMHKGSSCFCAKCGTKLNFKLDRK